VAAEPSAQPGTNRTNDTAEALAVESGKLISLLAAYHDANGSYRDALTRINAELPDAAKPEQLRLLVSYLMVENDSMRVRTQALQMNLQKAKTQIESLTSRLEVARKEGHTCGLTGLHNRRGFDSMLAREMAQANASGSPLCLVMADIDHFKSVNDRFGHLTGDDVLKWIARILIASMKGRDTIARYGGEEFALILPHTELRNAMILAGQIREQIEQTKWRLPGSQSEIRITASFGIAAWTPGEEAASLIRRADEMLYAAKATGRNKVMS
jgi:diguanylate cyclase